MYHYLFTLDADELEKIKVAASESSGSTHKKYKTKEDMDELESDVQEFIDRRDVLKEIGLTVAKFLEGKAHVESSFQKYTRQNPSNRRALPNGKIVLARQLSKSQQEAFQAKVEKEKREKEKRAIKDAGARARVPKTGKIPAHRKCSAPNCDKFHLPDLCFCYTHFMIEKKQKAKAKEEN